MKRSTQWTLALSLISSLACNQAPGVLTAQQNTDPTEIEDAIDEVGVTAGKADGPFSSCDLAQMVAFANDPHTDKEALKRAGVHARAAGFIPAYRNGLDGIPGTADDDVFESAEELDSVVYVGPVAFRQLATHVAPRCDHIPTPAIEVVFSPQKYEESHLVQAMQLIHTAKHSVDVAMYSFRDTNLLDALGAAGPRGGSVRVISENARADRADPEGTISAKLEERGVDVRWVNKIMHHKFCIIDGPQTYSNDPRMGVLMTGSGNWSHSAGTKYDENMVILHGHYEALYAYQQEFELLWDNSRDFVWNSDIAPVLTSAITDAMHIDSATFQAWFTSRNMRTYVSAVHGPTFGTLSDMNTVSDQWVNLIANAQESIQIASGHLRSRPITDALIAKVVSDPNVQIQVYLDGQEFISEYWHEVQNENLALCLEAAGSSDSKIQSCMDKGFLFGYSLHLAGIDVRYKYYSYRWHYKTAQQMHHKYMIIDGNKIVTGSYNLSDNAEHQTMENILVLDAADAPHIVSEFDHNFINIWETGRLSNRYDELTQQIEEATDSFPLVFPSMALDWNEVSELKALIRSQCPDINSEAYREAPEDHLECVLE